ncbi:MAG: 4Fe-4S ferredoxin [Pseudomonadota bacterium]
MTTPDRQSMDVDIACVGFGPAMGGFLTTLSKALAEVDENGYPKYTSRVNLGMPLQVLCYERADDVGFGVSGVVTKARAIRESFPDLDPATIPMAHPITEEKLIYLLDPIGASRRTKFLKMQDNFYRNSLSKLKYLFKFEYEALQMPFIPPFLNKHHGLVLSIGQFTQWVSSQVLSTGMVQLWPGTPAQEAIIEGNQVMGVRLADQGVDKSGKPTDHYMPGTDIRAKLTVVGDGPVGPIGAQLDDYFGMPEGHHVREWAVGMKMVVDLPADTPLKAGTVLHTFGFPEPEIFGFFYVHPNNQASLGIFVPSFLDSPVRSTYRYLQHWIQHPYLWQYLKNATLKSWGAKSLQESGKQGEPFLVGNGYARIGEGSGSTNVLTGSGVDEAWMTGILMAQGVIDILREHKPFTRENLEATYLRRRQESWVEKEAQIAKNSRNGFRQSFLMGMLGMGITGFTQGLLRLSGPNKRPWERIPSIEEYYKDIIPPGEIQGIREEARKNQLPLHDLLMDRAGWPKIKYDGKILISHQDALLLGGKVQAPEGYADHVAFLYPHLCESCDNKLCIEICSAQAIMPGETGGVPAFDREKCIHCGACLWNCTQGDPHKAEATNVKFKSGAGGLHSAEN